MSIINYLFIGFFLTFLLDYISFKLNYLDHIKIWTWKERILLVFFWPIFLIVFIFNFIKTYFK